jgi:hypothetical protein
MNIRKRLYGNLLNIIYISVRLFFYKMTYLDQGHSFFAELTINVSILKRRDSCNFYCIFWQRHISGTRPQFS